MDCSPPGSFVRGTSQVRILEWDAISFSGGSSWPTDGTRVSCLAGGFYATVPLRSPKQLYPVKINFKKDKNNSIRKLTQAYTWKAHVHKHWPWASFLLCYVGIKNVTETLWGLKEDMGKCLAHTWAKPLLSGPSFLSTLVTPHSYFLTVYSTCVCHSSI